jgi:Regulator of Chromosome Condensation (RCC1) repeat protein
VWCWGGETGVGNGGSFLSIQVRQPAPVAGLNGVVALAGGEATICALRTAGDVWCWGQGDPAPSISADWHSRPTQVPGIAGASAISVGSSHACAIVANGKATCWGRSETGELGDGVILHTTAVMVDVPLSDVRSISAGPRNTCAVVASDRAYCWGYNDSGQLGIGTFGNMYATPQEVQGLSNAVDIESSATTCALTVANDLYCWGGSGIFLPRLERSGVQSPHAMPLNAGSVLELQVTGRAGVPVDAAAVVLNVTVDAPQASGFLSVYPCGQPPPLVSNLNYVAGATVPNLVVVQPGVGGKVCIFAMATTEVIADVFGYFPAGSSFSALTTPQRILDTRNGTGAPVATVQAGSVLELQVTGRAGVPVDAAAVVLNVTVDAPQASGFLSVYPCGQPPPLVSNLNYVAGATVPNLVVVQPGVGGKVCIFAMATTEVIADVFGYFPAGSSFSALTTPQRILDTRNGTGIGP